MLLKFGIPRVAVKETGGSRSALGGKTSPSIKELSMSIASGDDGAY
jgi:hypothetical protein